MRGVNRQAATSAEELPSPEKTLDPPTASGTLVPINQGGADLVAPQRFAAYRHHYEHDDEDPPGLLCRCCWPKGMGQLAATRTRLCSDDERRVMRTADKQNACPHQHKPNPHNPCQNQPNLNPTQQKPSPKSAKHMPIFSLPITYCHVSRYKGF